MVGKTYMNKFTKSRWRVGVVAAGMVVLAGIAPDNKHNYLKKTTALWALRLFYTEVETVSLKDMIR